MGSGPVVRPTPPEPPTVKQPTSSVIEIDQSLIELNDFLGSLKENKHYNDVFPFFELIRISYETATAVLSDPQKNERTNYYFQAKAAIAKLKQLISEYLATPKEETLLKMSEVSGHFCDRIALKALELGGKQELDNFYKGLIEYLKKIKTIYENLGHCPFL